MAIPTDQITIRLKNPHRFQRLIRNSKAKRKVVRSGRRGGKTVTAAIVAAEDFLQGRRVLYATPTQDQVEKFWHEITQTFQEPIEQGIFYKNETRHLIEVPGTEIRIRAKTAYNANTLRGDYADKLILDEYQLMSEDAWNLVGAPMLLDNDGDALFIFTKRLGRHHTDELYKKAELDKTGRWEVFTFSSFENPHISKDALADISGDMSQMGYRAEILSEDIDDNPAALWTRELFQRWTKEKPDLWRIIVGVDPQATSGQTGIVVGGQFTFQETDHVLILEDATPVPGVSPGTWGRAAVDAYNRWEADRIIGEVNNGGDMIENVIRNVPGGEYVAYGQVRATRGKAVRAEPVVAKYEQERVWHFGEFPDLEDECCNWVPGESKWSPNRVDALVWTVTELLGLGDWLT